MVISKVLGTRQPKIPVNVACPTQFEEVIKKQPKSITLLAKLPVRNLMVSAQVSKPELKRFNRMLLKANVGTVIDKNLNMSAIPENQALWYTKQLQSIAVFGPIKLNSRIFRSSSSLHKKSRSLRRIRIGNTYRTDCGIFRYWGQQCCYV